MMTNKTATIAIALMTAAGMAAPAWAGPDKANDAAHARAKPGQAEQRSGMRDRAARPDGVGVYEFHRASTLMGSSVENREGETIASVEDFVLERGTGTIEQVLLKTGDILGFGGKTVAVPYGRFSFNREDDRFRIDMTPEQLERAAKFVPSNWSELDRDAWNTPAEDWLSDLLGDGPREKPADTFGGDLEGAHQAELDGVVLSVRRDWIDGTEQVVLVVNTKDGETQSVILGPSWYVMGQDRAPQRGDAIRGDMLVFPSDAGERRALIAATLDGDRITLRNADGRARWTASSGGERAEATRRYVLMSSLLGAAAKIPGKDQAGEIQDVVIERNSGQIALLGFDPNTNVLGLGDEIKCVPWQAANLAHSDDVRIDATDRELMQTEALPDDVTVLAVPAKLRPVYLVFGLEPAVFPDRAPQRAQSWMHDEGERSGMGDRRPLNGWSSDAPLMKALKSGESTTLAGEVIAVSTVRLGEHEEEARALTVKADGSAWTVILGPDRFFAHRDQAIREGDHVRVEGWKSTIDGKTYIAARTVEGPGRTLALFDGDDVPIWNTN